MSRYDTWKQTDDRVDGPYTGECCAYPGCDALTGARSGLCEEHEDMERRAGGWNNLMRELANRELRESELSAFDQLTMMYLEGYYD